MTNTSLGTPDAVKQKSKKRQSVHVSNDEHRSKIAKTDQVEIKEPRGKSKHACFLPTCRNMLPEKPFVSGGFKFCSPKCLETIYPIESEPSVKEECEYWGCENEQEVDKMIPHRNDKDVRLFCSKACVMNYKDGIALSEWASKLKKSGHVLDKYGVDLYDCDCGGCDSHALLIENMWVDIPRNLKFCSAECQEKFEHREKAAKEATIDAMKKAVIEEEEEEEEEFDAKDKLWCERCHEFFSDTQDHIQFVSFGKPRYYCSKRCFIIYHINE